MSSRQGRLSSMETIYVKLLDEGTEVFRPVPSVEVETNVYKLGSLESTEGDEKWEFEPGSIVTVENRILGDESVPVAIKLVS